MIDMESTDLQQVDIQYGSTMTQITSAEVDMQVSTAKRFPRSLKTFKHEVLSLAAIDEETARACTYTVPRSGKHIVGPSIRFMEIVASAWGNLREEKRCLEPEGNIIRGQSTVWDMERNRLVRVEATRRIVDKNGRRYNDDMIVMTGNAAASVAHRNALRACIPEGFWRKIWQQVQLVGAGDRKTLSENRKAWLDRWQKRGISAERVCASLGVPSTDDIGMDELAAMQGLETAIKQGDITIDDAFPPLIVDAPTRPASGQFSFKRKNEKVPAQATEVKNASQGVDNEVRQNVAQGNNTEHAKQNLKPVPGNTVPQSEPDSAAKFLDDQSKKAREQFDIDEAIARVKQVDNIADLITLDQDERRQPVLMAIAARCEELEQAGKTGNYDKDDERPWEKYMNK